VTLLIQNLDTILDTILDIVLAAGAALLLIRAWLEPLLLDIVTVQVRRQPGPAGSPASGPPPDRTPLRVLLLSDLHAECLLLKGCAEARPDLILFAGDLAARPDSLTVALDLFRKIRSLPELIGCPFIAVQGNHDSDATVAGLRAIGVTVMQNEAVSLVLQGETWAILGLEDLKTGQPDIPAVLHQAEASGVPPERRIVLSHNPDTLLNLPQGQVALFLSGHLHGGQIWLPFKLEFRLLRGEKLPGNGHTRGFFIWCGTPAYISRGLGCVKLPLRLFSKPELTIFEIC
jgi:predicted MPP superfamily phosphohydrolase